ncbi:MAG: carbamoyl-phosphate synthase large subunit [Planctomycetota bacterium]
MPRRTDLETIMLIGSGPIVIGQGCEFDYSGTQACKALREEGYRIVLVNSNPATIMTDPQFADRTYIEPITPAAVEKIIEAERPDAVLPTLGGQTGLNTAAEVYDTGVLDAYNVEMIGATRSVIHKAEDRTEFKEAMLRIGLDVPRSGVAHSMEEARAILEELGLPLCIRPAYTLGGTGGGFAFNVQEFETIVRRGLDASMVTEVLIEESVLGWKEYELEVMRDKADNVVIVCSIENVDPMGVHTGDSITVAPAQTLSDKEYQLMRDASILIMREIGVETGGSNVQFAVDPATGRMIVVEMNPRVSRSSALASKATGFPIAKIAAKLAVGYTLDEIPNDITRRTPACFEPTIDYVVTKIPRWTFEKFPEADETLTTQMKSVGEAMSIGRTFKESLQKGIRSMEVKRFGLGLDANDKWLAGRRGTPGAEWPVDADKLRRKLQVPSQGRLYYVRYALRSGYDIEQVHAMTGIDPWFLRNLADLVAMEHRILRARSLAAMDADLLRRAKQWGYSDVQLAGALGTTEQAVRGRRDELGIRCVYKLVDTCAAEFEAATPYYYSTYETPIRNVAGGGTFTDDEVRVSDREKIIILGGGPNRIGQGIEFDYCCVHAAFAAQELGYEAVMVNSNPETVSTDYDTSDLLFFEPLTHEDVLNICERLNGRPLGEPGGLLKGVIVQFGGQTPLNLARGLEAAGVPIIGTSPDSIDLAEDREQFDAVLTDLDLMRPANGTAFTLAESRRIAATIGYPVLVRPSYVLGGRAMEIVSDESQLADYMAKAVDASTVGRDHPILVDKFLDGATEVDVDCIADYRRVDGGPTGRAIVCGVMEHIEQAGVHSGDSACALPPYSLAGETVEAIKAATRAMAERLGVNGLMNIQYAVKDGQVYVLEVNPRASRTVPFVSKATGAPWAKLAAKVMAGRTLDELGVTEPPRPAQTSVKESVFPFAKFPGVDVILGPEMRSTGEVMGIDLSYPLAFAKSQLAAGVSLPTEGTVFISVSDPDKPAAAEIAGELAAAGFTVVATHGTHAALTAAGVEATRLNKLAEGRPNVADLITNGEVHLLINTPTRKGCTTDEGRIRALATSHNTPLITTITGARAAVGAIAALVAGQAGSGDPNSAWGVRALQDYFPTS